MLDPTKPLTPTAEKYIRAEACAQYFADLPEDVEKSVSCLKSATKLQRSKT